VVFLSFFDGSVRFSRALRSMGSCWAFLILPLYRYLLSTLNVSGIDLASGKLKRIAIVASANEARRIAELINSTDLNIENVGHVSPDDTIQHAQTLGQIHQLHDIIRINKIDELIFSAEDIP